jgi:hypothetical protein
MAYAAPPPPGLGCLEITGGILAQRGFSTAMLGFLAVRFNADMGIGIGTGRMEKP